MRIFIVTPAGKGSRNGNRNTAVRWAHLLASLGHATSVETEWAGQPTDLLIALHARRSHPSIARYRNSSPAAPLVLALTGTDLYRDIRFDADAQASMRLADRMIVLQEHALNELAAEMRAKTHVIYQSAAPLRRSQPAVRSFEIVVIGHLREEKDPFRTALACRFLPPASRLRVLHLGRAMSEEMQRDAQRLMRIEPRYLWLGERPHWQVRRYLARARALVISSRMEGGANVASEALAGDVPILASAVSGNIGMLGEDYEGYYPVEDERALGALLEQFETDAAFRRRLQAQCRSRKPLISVKRERASLRALIEDLGDGKRRGTPYSNGSCSAIRTGAKLRRCSGQGP
jgi:putative glycosyltransferase (TIGR04348 family)